MDTFDGRLTEVLKARELKPRDLYMPGPYKVLSKAAVYWLLDGTTTKAGVRDVTMAKLCKALRVNRLWLTDGKGPRDIEAVPLVQKKPSAAGAKTSDGSQLGRISERILFDAENLLAAFEKAHGKLSVKRRTRELSKIYNRLAEDGGKLSAEHLAELDLGGSNIGLKRATKPTR